MQKLKQKSYRDFSKGNWCDIQSIMAPENSTRSNLNLDSDVELGSLVSRHGTTNVNVQIMDGKLCLGLHNFRDSVGAGSKLFAVFSDGTNTDIYDALTGEKSLEDDKSSMSPSLSPSVSPSVSVSVSPSASSSLSPSRSPSISPSVSPPNSISPSVSSSISPSRSPSISPSASPTTSVSRSPSISSSISPSQSPSVSPSPSPHVSTAIKTRFLTYLDSCLRLNGTDQPKAYNGESWIDTGGAFDLDNLPQTAKYAIEFKDRVYVAGMYADPDRVDISGIANSVTRAVSWTTGNKFVVFEQEDGGGGITGLAKVPGYVLVFKKRTLKRYDGTSAYPEDMTNQGAPSQEAIVTAKGICFWVNENGAWASTGGKPKKISSFSVDSVLKSCSATDLLNVASGTDEEHIFWSFASVEMNGTIHTNVVCKYNISLNTWDIRQYPTLHRCYAKFVDVSDAVYTVFGDDDGNVAKLDTGDTDDGTAITYSMEPQDWDFGLRMFKKEINRMAVITENVSQGTLMWRNSHREEEWKPVGTINNGVEEFKDIDLEGNFFNFKISEAVTTGQAKILGIEFPAGGVTVYNE